MMSYSNYGNPNMAYNQPFVPNQAPYDPNSQSQTLQFGFYDSNFQQGQQDNFYGDNSANANDNESNSNRVSGFQPPGNNYYAQQQPKIFTPAMEDNSSMNQNYDLNEDNTTPDNEPPLLEELGINFSHIMAKTVAVLNPIREPNAEILGDADLAGPLLFCIAFGFCLLMAGKVSFGHIYLLAIIGCLSMYSLLNLMSQQGVALILTVSILGYCLLPMVPLSFVAVFFSLQSVLGHVVVGAVTLWCSLAASKLFSQSLSMMGQQALIAYPCFLVYGLFALLAVF